MFIPREIWHDNSLQEARKNAENLAFFLGWAAHNRLYSTTSKTSTSRDCKGAEIIMLLKLKKPPPPPPPPQTHTHKYLYACMPIDGGTSVRLPVFPLSNRSTIDPQNSTFFHKPQTQTNLSVIWLRNAGTALRRSKLNTQEQSNACSCLSEAYYQLAATSSAIILHTLYTYRV
jgi:hypothetical protein